MRQHPQLTLMLDTAPSKSFDNFHVDENNVMVRDGMGAFVRGSLKEEQIFLWGEAGTGKSHLLSAACDVFSEQGYRIAYLPGEIANSTGALDGLEQCQLVCIDDLQRLDHAAEIDLFHLVNRCRDAGTLLIFAADRSPANLGLKLPDLQTRLSWGLVFHLQSLSEEGLHRAFKSEVEQRSLEASEEVLGYVLRRFPRRMNILKQIVDILDAASLTEQRRITVPFVKTIFDDADRASWADRIR